MRGVPSAESDVYMTPTPAAVAKLVATHTLDAACGRWFWMGERTLSQLAQIGRAQAGVVPGRPKRNRGYSDAQAAVAVEAGHVLGSAKRGLRAAGILGGTNPQVLYAARGLAPPRISPEERRVATRLALAAKAGDPSGQDVRLAHELAVGRVLRVTLALVPTQPRTGRYRLPPVDANLAAALAGEDAAAIAAVFPDIAMEAR
ncbi:hypothetical protein MEX01_50190 [Methylorubrum extorquens]|nr:hypothetical protein MEX01_50190 [Methylorubrum extorquens]